MEDGMILGAYYLDEEGSPVYVSTEGWYRKFNIDRMVWDGAVTCQLDELADVMESWEGPFDSKPEIRYPDIDKR